MECRRSAFIIRRYQTIAKKPAAQAPANRFEDGHKPKSGSAVSWLCSFNSLYSPYVEAKQPVLAPQVELLPR